MNELPQILPRFSRVWKNAVRHCSTYHPWKNAISPGEVTTTVGQQPLTFKCGQLARFADGAAVCQIGQTSVLVTAVSNKTPNQEQNFLPLTVDYRQKAAAAGRLPTNRLRREMGQSDREILTSRFIDRSLRPLFAKNLIYGETQVVCNLLAVDGINDADVAAINAASCALALSDVPWDGPIGAVRLGIIDGVVVVNPSRKLMKKSTLDLVMSATAGKSVVMMEAEADCITIDDLFRAFNVGVKEIGNITEAISDLAVMCGKKKRELSIKTEDTHLVSVVREAAYERFAAILSDSSLDKVARDQAFRQAQADVLTSLQMLENKTCSISSLREALDAAWRQQFREVVLKQGRRCDGRSPSAIRPIFCDTDLHPPLHGSALFQRGQTQVSRTQ